MVPVWACIGRCCPVAPRNRLCGVSPGADVVIARRARQCRTLKDVQHGSSPLPRLTRRGARNQFHKENNSSGWCGRPHGNDASGWSVWTYCIPAAYFGTLKGCDAFRVAKITHRFSCGPPSTKHSFLVPASGIFAFLSYTQ
jgi:hypothetical protein